MITKEDVEKAKETISKVREIMGYKYPNEGGWGQDHIIQAITLNKLIED